MVRPPRLRRRPKQDGKRKYHTALFGVELTKYVGYRAADTLAGNRTNSALRDIAAPVSVVTMHFLDDNNAFCIDDILALNLPDLEQMRISFRRDANDATRLLDSFIDLAMIELVCDWGLDQLFVSERTCEMVMSQEGCKLPLAA